MVCITTFNAEIIGCVPRNWNRAKRLEKCLLFALSKAP